MALAFYDSDLVALATDPLRTFHDGHLGGSYEIMVNIRNDDVAKYYTNNQVFIELLSYNDFGEYGTSGWSAKLMFGARQPTEAEWDIVRSGDSISIPDIGTTLVADTSTYHPVWLRIFAPAGNVAQIRDNQRIRLFYFERALGD
jgi:hypothetical protein